MTISIDEQSFLRDRQQAVLYHLTRFGESDAKEIAQRTFYSTDEISQTLMKLSEKQSVVRSRLGWRLSPEYEQLEREYIEKIRRFELATYQQQISSHKIAIFNVPDSRIHGASFVADNANETMIIFPGNGFNLVPDVLEITKMLAPNRNVFVMEYPGMGNSAGELTVSTLKKSASQFFRHVRQKSEVSHTRMIVYGFSLGGFVATHIASSQDIDALILDSTAPDMQTWVDSNVPNYAKAFVDIDIHRNLLEVSNIKNLRLLTIPMLFISGQEDHITPPALMEELFDAAVLAEFKNITLLDNVNHGESIEHYNFRPAIDQFLQKVANHSTPELILVK